MYTFLRPGLLLLAFPLALYGEPTHGPVGFTWAVLARPAYRGRDTLPVALAGQHGGGFPLKAFPLAAWIKPARRMG